MRISAELIPPRASGHTAPSGTRRNRSWSLHREGMAEPHRLRAVGAHAELPGLIFEKGIRVIRRAGGVDVRPARRVPPHAPLRCFGGRLRCRLPVLLWGRREGHVTGHRCRAHRTPTSYSGRQAQGPTPIHWDRSRIRPAQPSAPR